MELDLKDKKILYQLDLNPRQSNAQIGRKVGLSKQMTGHKIKKLETVVTIKKRVISNICFIRIYTDFIYPSLLYIYSPESRGGCTVKKRF